MENIKLGKGLFAQIQDRNFVSDYNKISAEDIKKFLKKAHKDDIANSKRLRENYNNTLKHLEKRSKELNQEIPLDLLYRFTPFADTYVDSRFTEKYKVWL